MSEHGISSRRVAMLFAARLIAPAVTLFVFSLVSYVGAPGELGLFYYAYNFVTLFQMLANFGFDSFLMREVAKTPERARLILANSIAILVPYGVLLAVAMPSLVRALGYSGEIWHPLWYGAPALPAMALAYAMEAILMGRERFGAVAAGNIVDGVLRMGLSAATFALGYGTSGLLASIALARGATVVLYLVLLSRSPGVLPLQFRPSVVWELLRGTRAFVVMYLGYAIGTKLDGALLARLATPEDGDAYSIPNRLTQALFILSGTVIATVFPAMAKAAGTDRLGRMVSQSFRLFLIPSVPLAALLSCFPMPVVLLLSGREKAPEAARMMVFLAWSILAVMLNEPVLRGLIAAHGQRVAAVNAWIFAALMAAGLTPCILTWGALGAAAAFPVILAINCAQNALTLAHFTKLTDLFRDTLRVGASAAISLPLLYWLAPRIGLLAAIPYLLAYVGLLLATRAMTWAELRDPRRMLLF